MSDARQLSLPVASHDEAVALFRYGLIADLLHLPPGHRRLQVQLREKADREYDIPGSARRRVAAETLRDWLYAYRRNGFDALKPRPRRDRGQTRVLPPAVADQLCALKEAHPAFSVAMLIATARQQHLIAPEVVLAPATVHRLLSRQGLMARRPEDPTAKDRRRFAFDAPNELWMSDVMHGPSVLDPDDRRRHKTYLIALLDDATRVIPYAAFATFYPDDPITVDHDAAFDASGVKVVDLSQYYDFLENTVGPPADSRAEHQHARRGARLELVHQPHRPLSERSLEQGLRRFEDTFEWCLDTVLSIKDGTLQPENLHRFQPRLFQALLTLSRVYHDIHHERRRLISRKHRLSTTLHARQQARLDRWQKIILQAIGIGRNVADAFLWFFYRNDLELLRRHRQQPPPALPPTGDGGEGELALIDAVRFLGKRFVLFHGITTLFRLGDASLLDLDSQRIVGIGELKTTRLDSRRLNLQFVASFSADAVVPNAEAPSANSVLALDSRRQARLDKQLAWMSTDNGVHGQRLTQGSLATMN